MRTAGEIEKCPDCDTWHVVATGCPCKQSANCTKCGKPSNGKPLCLDCWKASKAPTTTKPADNTATVDAKTFCKICAKPTKGWDICWDCKQSTANNTHDYARKVTISEVIKDSDGDIRKKFEARFRCTDGHYVRSKAEMLIDNWLYEHRIAHAYEKKVYMPKNPDETVLSDFYLPEGKVFIEYWGMESEKYKKRKEVKISLYSTNGLNLISLEDEHISRLDDILPWEIGKFTDN